MLRVISAGRCRALGMVSCFLLYKNVQICLFCFVFFFNDTATTEIYTLSLHDALPIWAVEPVKLFNKLKSKQC